MITEQPRRAGPTASRKDVPAIDAESLLKRFLGIGVTGYFDAPSAEADAAALAAELIPKDYAGAVALREAIRSARRIRKDQGLPRDLGWPREALRVARKIFGELRGRIVGGSHGMTRHFLEAGCLDATDLRSDIAVIGEPADTERSCEIAFELSGTCAQAHYRFSAGDLERMMREEMKRSYPAALETLVGLEAERIRKRVETVLGGDPGVESGRTLEELQRGIASKYNDESSLRFLADRMKESISPLPVNELRMIRDFLEDCVAWKVASASRGKNR